MASKTEAVSSRTGGHITMWTGLKGGSSKSTLTVNMAAMLARMGHSVLIYDIDKQASAYQWSRTRLRLNQVPPIDAEAKYWEAYSIEEIQENGTAMMADLDAQRRKYDHILIDGSGSDNPSVRYGLIKADTVVVPMKPSQFDIWAARPFHKMLLEASQIRVANKFPRIDPVIVGSIIHSAGKGLWIQARDQMAAATMWNGFRFAKSLVQSRVIYDAATELGRGVVEMQRSNGRVQSPEACSDLFGVFEEIFGEGYNDRTRA